METNAIQSGEIRLDPKMMKVWVNENPLSLGIPAIAFGTCIGRRAHTVEENLDIDSLVPGFIQLAQFILSRPH